MKIPLKNQMSPARVVDYASQSRNIYLKDMAYNSEGYPAILYIRSYSHEPGKRGGPYEWCITKWGGETWQTFKVTESDHNYDMGSLFISEEEWKIVGPTEEGPQKWGVGGELAIWKSTDKGETWQKVKQLTKNSKMSHAYVRKVVNGKAPFNFLWADGHSHEFSKSELYFGDFKGNIWKLPYDMKEDYEKPLKVK